MIITTLGPPKAWVGGEEITRATVRALLDKLEEIVGALRSRPHRRSVVQRSWPGSLAENGRDGYAGE
jgi:hypothetical protein